MSRATHAQDAHGARPHLRLKIRRKLGRMIEPRAHRLLEWCRAAEAGNRGRIDVLEARTSHLEGRLDRSEWGREALVDRHNEQDIAIESLTNRLDEIEPMAQDAFWGRAALVERFNEADWRTSLVDEQLKKMQAQIDEYVIRPLALELDNLAVTRRLATIEDLLEQVLAQNAGGQDSSASLVPFRPADDSQAQAAG